jgi:DNA-binding transcriptional LysR family regulator
MRQHGKSGAAPFRVAACHFKRSRDLENTLEVRLLDRGPLGVEPLLYGSALVRRGLAVFDELRQAVGEIEFMANPPRRESAHRLQ